MVTYLVAMGNTKGIVKRLRIETIDAAKYLYIITFLKEGDFKWEDEKKKNGNILTFLK